MVCHFLKFPESGSYSFYVSFVFTEFLGRTEIQISALIEEKKKSSGGPLTKKIALLETESGMVTLRLDLQMFKK